MRPSLTVCLGTLILAVACGTPASQRSPDYPAPAPVATASLAPAVDEAPTPQQPRLTDEQLLELLSTDRPNFELAVKRISDGDVYQELGGRVSNAPSGADLFMVLPVLEGPHSGDEPPRVMCDNGRIRIVVFIDRASLALVTLEDAAITSRPVVAESAADAVGVFLHPGEVLDENGSDAGAEFRRVRYEGHDWSSEGYIAATSVGNVYRRQPEQRYPPANHAVPRGTTLLDGPNGVAFAHLDDISGLGNGQYVRPIRTEAGFVLIEFSTERARVVGWAPEVDVESVPEFPGGLGRRGTGLRGWGRVDNPIELAEGSLLYSEPSRRPLGIVRRAHPAECLEGCDGDSDWVIARISTCVGAMSVAIWNTR